MFALVVVDCICFCLIIGVYLRFFSPYRIQNWHGFILLFLTFTTYSIYISILPLCQLYLLYFLLFVDLDSFNYLYHSIIVFYCVIESFFFLFTIEEARLLNNRPLPRWPSLPKNYEEQFVDRIAEVYEKSSEDFRLCFTEWFDGVNYSNCNLIYEENIFQYIAMITYGVKYCNELTEEQQQYIRRLFENGYLRRYPQHRELIKSGFNDQIQLKNPYRDEIHYTHYPMIKYFSFAVVRSIVVMFFQLMNYEYQVIGNVTFYVRQCPTETKLSPILFLHGLSLGANSYILFIRRLTSLNRTIILLDIPYASMRLYTEVSSMSTVLSAIEKLLISLNENHVTTIGHSYGTLIQSCLIKQLPHLVHDQTVLFIDPICFLVFDSRFTNNFIYRKPRTPNQLLLHTSCAEELYIMYAIQRHLCWYESNLWAEDVKQSQIRTHVFLSEKDDIVPVAFVANYLNKWSISTTVFPGFKHAQFLITPKVQEQILEVLHQLEAGTTKNDADSLDF